VFSSTPVELLTLRQLSLLSAGSGLASFLLWIEIPGLVGINPSAWQGSLSLPHGPELPPVGRLLLERVGKWIGIIGGVLLYAIVVSTVVSSIDCFRWEICRRAALVWACSRAASVIGHVAVVHVVVVHVVVVHVVDCLVIYEKR
jgi:hypothetical protein